MAVIDEWTRDGIDYQLLETHYFTLARRGREGVYHNMSTSALSRQELEKIYAERIKELISATD